MVAEDLDSNLVAPELRATDLTRAWPAALRRRVDAGPVLGESGTACHRPDAGRALTWLRRAVVGRGLGPRVGHGRLQPHVKETKLAFSLALSGSTQFLTLAFFHER